MRRLEAKDTRASLLLKKLRSRPATSGVLELEFIYMLMPSPTNGVVTSGCFSSLRRGRRKFNRNRWPVSIPRQNIADLISVYLPAPRRCGVSRVAARRLSRATAQK